MAFEGDPDQRGLYERKSLGVLGGDHCQLMAMHLPSSFPITICTSGKWRYRTEAENVDRSFHVTGRFSLKSARLI